MSLHLTVRCADATLYYSEITVYTWRKTIKLLYRYAQSPVAGGKRYVQIAVRTSSYRITTSRIAQQLMTKLTQ
jgi:hypothetical protein